MRALIAFDKFKDCLTAEEAGVVAAEALHAVCPTAEIELCPLADGGEGFAPILTATAQGTLRSATVTGPRGAPVAASFGEVPTHHLPAAVRAELRLKPTDGNRHLAVIEMAAASGLALLAPAQRDPWQTTSFGAGELIRHAAERGAEAIVLGVGGSATNDLGLGALTALGLRCLDHASENLSAPVPGRWEQLVRVSGQLVPLPPLFIACDVTNPLLGARGASYVYGPQKGLRPEDAARLDHACARLALMLCSHFGRSDALMDRAGAGAAGGIAFGLMVAADAQLISGFDFVARWLDLDRRIAEADVVITGEGRFDDTSLTGKGPGAVAARARAAGKRVEVFAGSAPGQPIPGIGLHAITPAGMPLPEALAQARGLLGRAVGRVFS